MRRWILWLLVLVLGFWGAIGSSILFREIVAAETVEAPMESLQTVEGDSDNAVEVDGVRLEILVPERTWIIPENKPGSLTPVQLGFRLTNLRQEAVRFPLFEPVPVIIDASGKQLSISGGREGYITRSPLVCRLLIPGESLTFFPNIQLNWQENKLNLVGLYSIGGGWFYKGLQAGTYQIKLIGDTNHSLGFCLNMENINSETNWNEIKEKLERMTEDFWLNVIQTPLIEIQLIKPLTQEIN